MEQPLFHVMLGDRKLGPYDRRTIVGMRIKNTLSSGDMLADSSGMPLTVADLIGRKPRSNDFSPNRTGGVSVVQGTYPAGLAAVDGSGVDIPEFKGEIEVRVQSDVLRIAGRFRRGLGWKEDRIKLPLQDIVHTRVEASLVHLWLRPGATEALQRISLELFTGETAKELVGWLPMATPWPDPVMQRPAATTGNVSNTGVLLLWASVLGIVFVIGVALALLLHRRL